MSLDDNAGTTAKRIDGLGSTFRPRYVRGNVRDIEALVNEMTEVCLFVPSAEFPQKLDTRVVESGFSIWPAALPQSRVRK
jgi:hypothetical protein